jgi:hypothetical protein
MDSFVSIIDVLSRVGIIVRRPKSTTAADTDLRRLDGL